MTWTVRPSPIPLEPVKREISPPANACPDLGRRGLGKPEEDRTLPRWRKDSFFGAGPRCPRTREELARFRWLVNQNRGPRRLSPGHADVLLALAATLGADGRLDPSHAFLAALAVVSVSTVQRALDRGRELGLIWWQRRLELRAWRCEQTSNAYVLCCDCQVDRADKIVSCKRGIEVEAGQSAGGSLAPSEAWASLETRILAHTRAGQHPIGRPVAAPPGRTAAGIASAR